MIADIRGSLGTQVISLAACAPVTAIRLNVAPPIHPDSCVDYLSDIFDGLPPVTKVDAARKVPADMWGEALTLKSRRALCLKRKITHHGATVLHVRTGDRQSTSVATYARLAHKYHDASHIGTGAFARGSAVDDWYTVLGADRVYSSVTMFTISAAVFNPALRLFLLEPDGPIPLQPAALRAVRAFVMLLPNVQWVTP